MNKSLRRIGRLAAVVLLLAACTPHVPVPPTPTPGPQVEVKTTTVVLEKPAPCEGRFVPHDLSVSNGVRVRDISTYLSNGSGVAVADLNGDGLPDIVLGSIDREVTILWNQGNFNFKEDSLDDLFTRAVSAVDVDGDGRIDLVFTHTSLEEVTYWHNQGNGHFVKEPLPGVTYPAYALGWADLNGDGRLDLVTGSYNTDLKAHVTDAAQLAQTAGIYYYQNTGSGFLPQRLSATAETLSVGLLDLDGDGRPDIYAANDFLTPDMIWLRRGSDAAGSAGGPGNAGVWLPAQDMFRQTSYSTMSVEWGDLANDGKTEVFTTDMNPYDITPRNMAAWLPVMDKLEQGHNPNDPQVMANALQVPVSRGVYRNDAPRRGVDATGWSWSADFGDLDNDGYLDLYVVNGMIAKNLFGFLPDAELLEENQAFHNRGNGTFEHATTWGLNSDRSGRGMVMADLNMDGRLDIVINNLRSQAQVFENRLCGGDALEVDLHWPASQNPFAIGAQLELHTSAGVMRRDVRASGSYLSTNPSRMHFGFPSGARLDSLVVRWPDGAVSQIGAPQPHTLLEVTR